MDEVFSMSNDSSEMTRPSSQYGTIRGRTVSMSSQGGRPGRLDSSSAVAEHAAQQQTVEEVENKNYFKRVGSSQGMRTPSTQGEIRPSTREGRPSYAPLENLDGTGTWATQSFKQRVTLSRGGNRDDRRANMRAALQEPDTNDQVQQDLQRRRSSLHALSSGEKRGSIVGLPDRAQSLRIKQEMIRQGSTDFNGTFSGTGTVSMRASFAMENDAENDRPSTSIANGSVVRRGSVGSNWRPPSQGGMDQSFNSSRPSTSQGTAPVNPLTNRRGSNGRVVGRLVGAPRDEIKSGSTAIVDAVDDDDTRGCFCFRGW